MASQLASADSMTIFAAPIVADQAFPSGDPLTRSACHPIVERKNDSLHAMTEEEQQCITVQEKGRAVLSRPSRCQVARRMSSEPSAGILEVANEHGERKVAEGSSAVPQPKDFGRPDSTSDVEDEKREPDEAQDRGSETQGGNIKNLSMMSAFRDFFLAAFSDSYSYQDVRHNASSRVGRSLATQNVLTLFVILCTPVHSIMAVAGPIQPTARFREAASMLRRSKIVFGRKTPRDRTTIWSPRRLTIPAERGERSPSPLRWGSITRTT